MRWIVIILALGNAFFIYQTYFWQQQAIDQMIATSDVENMYSRLGYEIGYSQFIDLSSKSHNYSVSYDLSEDIHGMYTEKDGYEAFEIGGGHTLVFFKNGRYVGSRLKEVPGLGPWMVKAKYF
jgi:hypothetical protein